MNADGLDVIPAGEPGIDPGDAFWALCCITRHATSADDYWLLLEACGLAPYEHGPFQTYAYGRKP